jgi:hypothetical protein
LNVINGRVGGHLLRGRRVVQSDNHRGHGCQGQYRPRSLQ